MWDYLIAIVLVPLLLFGWLVVQSLARLFAKAHPEFGETPEEGSGCGSSCLCRSGPCQRKTKSPLHPHQHG